VHRRLVNGVPAAAPVSGRGASLYQSSESLLDSLKCPSVFSAVSSYLCLPNRSENCRAEKSGGYVDRFVFSNLLP
jgi:hypothetical protein